MTHLESLEHLAGGGAVTNGERVFVNYTSASGSMCCEVVDGLGVPARDGYYLGSLPEGDYEPCDLDGIRISDGVRWLLVEPSPKFMYSEKERR